MSLDEKLRDVYAATKQREAEDAAVADRQAVLTKRSFLGRTILSVSDDLTPTGYKFINLGIRDAGKAPLQAAYGLPGDFPFDDLVVRVRSNYDSWTTWQLQKSEAGGPSLARFRVVANPITVNDPRVDPETLMSWHESKHYYRPVAFEDENYRAIQLIATCFSTDIAAALSAEGM